MMKNNNQTYEFEELTKVFHNWASKSEYQSFTCTVKDAEDGTDDQFLIFPEGSLEFIGWKVGDTINFDFSDEKHLILTKID